MTRASMIKLGASIAIIAGLVGVFPTVYGMVTVFNESAANDAVNADLSSSVAMGVNWTVIAMPVAAIGIAMVIAGLFMKPKKTSIESSLQTDE